MKRSLFFFSLVSLIGVGQQLFSFLSFPVYYLQITGNGAKKVEKALHTFKNSTVKNTSIQYKKLMSDLTKSTDIKKIDCWSVLPGWLIIRAVVKQPIAIFQPHDTSLNSETFFIDAQGEIFTSDLKREDLPILIGFFKQSAYLLSCYQSLHALLKPHGITIKTVQVDEKNRCVILLSNGMQLLLGHTEPSKQIQQLLDVHPFVLHRSNDITSLDLRYPKGMAITWRSSVV